MGFSQTHLITRAPNRLPKFLLRRLRDLPPTAMGNYGSRFESVKLWSCVVFFFPSRKTGHISQLLLALDLVTSDQSLPKICTVCLEYLLLYKLTHEFNSGYAKFDLYQCQSARKCGTEGLYEFSSASSSTCRLSAIAQHMHGWGTSCNQIRGIQRASPVSHIVSEICSLSQHRTTHRNFAQLYRRLHIVAESRCDVVLIIWGKQASSRGVVAFWAADVGWTIMAWIVAGVARLPGSGGWDLGFVRQNVSKITTDH